MRWSVITILGCAKPFFAKSLWAAMRLYYWNRLENRTFLYTILAWSTVFLIKNNQEISFLFAIVMSNQWKMRKFLSWHYIINSNFKNHMPLPYSRKKRNLHIEKVTVRLQMRHRDRTISSTESWYCWRSTCPRICSDCYFLILTTIWDLSYSITDE